MHTDAPSARGVSSYDSTEGGSSRTSLRAAMCGKTKRHAIGYEFTHRVRFAHVSHRYRYALPYMFSRRRYTVPRLLQVCSAIPSAYGSSMIRKPRSNGALPIGRTTHMSHMTPPLRLAALAAMLAGALAGCATRDIPPANTALPESLRTPPQEVLEDVLTAVGETFYNCRRDGAQLSWVRKGSEATLVDQARRNVGTIVPGPRFLAYDGSYVSGRVAAQEIVATDALPWELIVARRTSGTEKDTGRFAKVTSLQQVRTRGGLPPQTHCTQQGISLLVPFSATYLVYRPATGQPPTTPAPESATAPVPTTTPVATPLSSAAGARTAAPASTPSAPAASPLDAAASSPIAAAPIAAPAAVSASSPAPILTIASVSESSVAGMPTFFDSLYIRP